MLDKMYKYLYDGLGHIWMSTVCHVCLLLCREFEDTNNKLDIGIKSAAGLKPKRLTQQEIKPDPRSEYGSAKMILSLVVHRI